MTSSALRRVWVTSNVRHPWSSLTFGPQRRDPRQPKRLRPIVGIDTETIDGYVWLLADSLDRHIFPSTWLEVLEWLEEGKLYRTTNLAWNMDYDARAILSLLDEGELLDLAIFQHLENPLYKVDYVPRKFLVIRYNRHRYELFDLMQFFNSSLNYSAKRYLGISKIDLDARRINDDADYREEHLDEIIDYCKRDAELTARLGVLNSELYQRMGLRLNKWYSTGYVAGRYFLTHGGIPRYHFDAPQQYAYYSYAGGRFECFQRGHFDQAYKYDITSAYPAVISTLPDLDRGRWVLDTKVDYDADLIFSRIRVRVKNNFVQPLHLKHRGLVVYPTTDFHQRIVTKSELELLSDFDLATVNVIDAWHFYADTSDRPFRSIEDMFKERLVLREMGDPRQIVLKVVMNSLYGKFIQITPRLLPEPHRRVGPLFIPAYASEITARTRMQLARTVLEREIRPVAMFTDCIITTDAENLASEGLGRWNLETEGELLLLGCGVYEFHANDKTDTHLRGFRVPTGGKLTEILSKSPNRTHFEFDTVRPVSLGEFFHSKLNESGHHLNQWIKRKKSLSLNFDRKRKWLRSFSNAQDALTSSHEGLPVYVEV